MLKFVITGAVTCLVLFATAFFFMGASVTPTIQWYTNYSQALDTAKKANKPMILFFTGSDWCTWCNKLDSEVLETTEFSKAVGNKFVFVKLDFPKKSPQSNQIAEQNKNLLAKYQVKAFPTLLILNSANEQVIGTANYRPGGPQSFAEYLNKLVRDDSRIKNIAERR